MSPYLSVVGKAKKEATKKTLEKEVKCYKNTVIIAREMPPNLPSDQRKIDSLQEMRLKISDVNTCYADANCRFLITDSGPS